MEVQYPSRSILLLVKVLSQYPLVDPVYSPQYVDHMYTSSGNETTISSLEAHDQTTPRRKTNCNHVTKDLPPLLHMGPMVVIHEEDCA
jgi:hypothetical protein